MDLFTVEGGVPLHGTIKISGSKNAALPILIATLLTDAPCTLSNVPDLDDIETVLRLIAFLGKKIDRQGDTVVIASGQTLSTEAPYELVRKMRASVVVMGPLLSRLGEVKVSLPGGCAIGGRPINIHLDGFRMLGAEITLDQGYVSMQAKRLKGTTIPLEFASVGATENLMMAATLAQGKTVIQNAAQEPEITDLAEFLNSMGARVQGAGTDTLTIEGVGKLHGANHRVIPDRIEAGTYLLAAVITGGALTLTGTRPDHLQSLIDQLKTSGVAVQIREQTLQIDAGQKPHATSIETQVYPGFPTDLQAQWMALMTQAEGTCDVSEKVFENRFMHVAELQRMGADIQIKGGVAAIQGVTPLSGTDVMVSDLRAGAALVLAGLAAKGKTIIHRVYHLDRGYEAMEAKLAAVGARIERSKEESVR